MNNTDTNTDIEMASNNVTKENLIEMVSLLIKKVENLETELKTIKSQMGKRGGGGKNTLNRENILVLLNDADKLTLQRKTIPPFTKWFNESVLPFVKDHLDIVFQNDIIYGIIRLLENSIIRCDIETLPIRIFERNHTHTYFYIFDGDDGEDTSTFSWKRVYFYEMETYSWNIYQQFNKDFYNYWCIPNQQRISNMDDEYSKLYIEYFRAILGNTNISHDKRNYKIWGLFYKKLMDLES